MKLLSNQRRSAGASLALVGSLVIVIMAIGALFFYIACMFGGQKENINATNAGAIAAARQIMAVGLTPAETKLMPLCFQALATDPNGQIPGLQQGANGYGPASGTALNALTFNLAAAETVLVACNAAEENQAGAGSEPIRNANALIAPLIKLGNKLTADIKSSSTVAQAVDLIAQDNSRNMLGTNSTISLVPNPKTPNGLTFAYISGANPRAPVYFNSNLTANDPTMQGWLASLTTSAAGTSTTNWPYAANNSAPAGSFQSGDPFLKAYTPLDMSAITGVPGFAEPIYAMATEPGQNTHLFSTSEFNKLYADPGLPDGYYSGTNTNGCYAPVNAVRAQTAATITNGGSKLLGHNTNGSPTITALACAMMTSLNIQYPAAIATGYVTIANGCDAVYAAKQAGQILPTAALTVTSVTNAMMNDELWQTSQATALGSHVPSSTGQGLGGVYMAGYNSATGVLDSTNSVFCTMQWDPLNGTAAPTGWTSGQGELNTWIGYAVSIAMARIYGSNFPHSGPGGGDPARFPGTTSYNGSPTFAYISPTANMHSGGTKGQKATPAQMLAIAKSIGQSLTAAQLTPSGYLSWEFYDNIGPSTPFIYGNYGITFCDTTSPDFGPNPASNAPCANSYSTMAMNYYGNPGGIGNNPITAVDSAPSSGGMFNLAYFKGEVMNAWYSMLTTNNMQYNGKFHITPVVPTTQSGMEVFDESGATGYAAPTNTGGSVNFAQVTTPYRLIVDQLYANGNNACSNITDVSSTGPWNDLNTPLGAMLKACQEILPSVTAPQVCALLNKYPIDLCQKQYIYQVYYGQAGYTGPTNGPPVLTISTSPPPWLGTVSSVPDGITLPVCSNTPFTNTDWNIIDAAVNQGSSSPNKAGDFDLHACPFTLLSTSTGDNTSASFSSTWNGTATITGAEGQITSQDNMTFTPNCGYNAVSKDNNLGVLTFGNALTTNGTLTYSNPN